MAELIERTPIELAWAKRLAVVTLALSVICFVGGFAYRHLTLAGVGLLILTVQLLLQKTETPAEARSNYFSNLWPEFIEAIPALIGNVLNVIAFLLGLYVLIVVIKWMWGHS
jgi:hypothetical protein